MKKTTFILGLLLLFLSCKEDKNYEFKPESIGQVHSVLVVMNENLWNSAFGDSIRTSFYAPLKGLSLVESRFNIQYIPPSVFNGTVKYNRTVLVADLDSLELSHIKTDVYAAPQKVAVIKSSTLEGLISNFKRNESAFVEAFKSIELEEAQKRFQRSLSTETTLQDKFKLSLSLPSIYKLGKETPSFLWFDRPYKNGSLNIIAYELPKRSFSNPNSFLQDIITKRDSVVKANIPGPDVPGKVTYMRTEKVIDPSIKGVQFAGFKAVEVRGMWDMANYTMAGPYVSYIINDTINHRKLVLEGFVFAPNELKRNLLFELEAILKTAEINP